MGSQRARYEINGFVDTSQAVWSNIEEMCQACNAWVTFDTKEGIFSVVLNEPDASVQTFYDEDYLGDLQIDVLPVDKMYNAGEIKFVNRDMIGKNDTLKTALDSSNLPLGYYNSNLEEPNILTLSNRFINDDIQARLVLQQEISNSRNAVTVKFTTDYRGLDLVAGDIISLPDVNITPGSNSYDQQFRIVNIEEVDGDGGELFLQITCVNINYETFNGSFIRSTVDRATGIPLIKKNTPVQESNDSKIGLDVAKIFDFLNPAADKFKTDSGIVTELLVRAFTISGPSTAREGDQVTYTITAPDDCCTNLTYNVPYTITGVSSTDIDVSAAGLIAISNGTGTLTINIAEDTTTEGDETLQLKVGCATKQTVISDTSPGVPVYTLTSSATTVDECDTLSFTLQVDGIADSTNVPYAITGIDAADLASGSLSGNFSADWTDGDTDTVTLTFNKNIDGTEPNTETINFNVDSGKATATVSLTAAATYSVSLSSSSIVEGATNTVTITTQGISDGTSVPYSLSGSGTGRVTSGLSGNVTISGNTGSFTISTDDDSDFQGSQTVTVTAGPVTGYETCSSTTATFTITDNDTAPPGDYTTIFTTVPVVWRGTYDGTDNQLKALTVAKYAQVQTFPEVGTAVDIPTSVTVTKGNPSTITINSTTTAYTGADFAGTPEDVITTFDSISPGASITGTISSVATWNT